MHLVLDASAGLDLAASRGGFDLVNGFDLLVPPVFWPECYSVLHERVWRRELSVELASTVRQRLIEASLTAREPENLHEEAWRVAEELGWAKVYDAEYVALARLSGCPLLTLDARLSRAAGKTVAIVGPSDLEELRPSS